MPESTPKSTRSELVALMRVCAAKEEEAVWAHKNPLDGYPVVRHVVEYHQKRARQFADAADMLEGDRLND